MKIRIDRRTLPKDGQRVKWRTDEDEDWKVGTFSSGDDLFCEGFRGATNKWDSSFEVLEWMPIS